MRFRNIVIAGVFVFFASLCTQLHADNNKNVIGKESAHMQVIANDKQLFEEKFTPLKDKVLDSEGYFSFSKVSTELKSLFPLATKIGKDSFELFELYDIYSLVLSKRETESKETINTINTFFDNFKHSKHLTDNKAYIFHYRLYKAYNYLDDIELSIYHLKQVLMIVERSNALEKENVLGLMEDLAYLYHENKKFKEALITNLEVEKVGKAMKIEEDKFIHLYNNVAQNYYELNQPEQAKSYLLKLLEASKKYGKVHFHVDSLFQLGVLAYEQDDLLKAKEYFKERIKIAKENNYDEDDIAIMEKDLSMTIR